MDPTTPSNGSACFPCQSWRASSRDTRPSSKIGSFYWTRLASSARSTACRKTAPKPRRRRPSWPTACLVGGLPSVPPSTRKRLASPLMWRRRCATAPFTTPCPLPFGWSPQCQRSSRRTWTMRSPVKRLWSCATRSTQNAGPCRRCRSPSGTTSRRGLPSAAAGS